MKYNAPRSNTKKYRKKKMNKTPKYFDLEEFLDSSVARQKGISNSPSWEVIEHLNELALVLDELREAWGSAINVTSGFRNRKLNNAVGGVANSSHQYGWAADLVPANGLFDKFVKFVKEWAKERDFDQILIETKGKSKWLHYGHKNSLGEQRKQFLNISK